MKKALLFICFILPMLANAQLAGRSVIRGRILGTDHKPVALAHIIHLETLRGTVSDTAGYFSMPLQPGDSLLVSRIGYATRIVGFTESTTVYSGEIEIVLLEQIYQLKEVVIHPFPSTWKEFSDAFKNLKTDPGPQPADLHLAKEGVPNYQGPSGGFGISMMSPISALYNLFGREPKSRRKYEALLASDRREAQVKQRYNPSLVKHLTGITDEEILKKFLDYCHLDDDFVLHCSDYELYVAILECYHSFCNKG